MSIAAQYRALYGLWEREILRFARRRSRLAGAILQPLLFWLLLGFGFGTSFQPKAGAPPGGYMQYLFPGMLLLTLLFTAIFATISVIEDRNRGFLQGVVVAPVSPATIVLGTVLGASTIAVAQAVLFLAIAPLASIPLTLATALCAALLFVPISIGLSSLGFLIAWRMESTQGFHAIMNMLLIPMWLLSGAFFPASGAPVWFGWAMRLNPMSYMFDALTHALAIPASPAEPGEPTFLFSLCVILLFTIVLLAAATSMVRASWGGGTRRAT